MNQNNTSLKKFNIEPLNPKFHPRLSNSFQRSQTRVNEKEFHIMLSIYEIQKMHQRVSIVYSTTQTKSIPFLRGPEPYKPYNDGPLSLARIAGIKF